MQETAAGQESGDGRSSPPPPPPSPSAASQEGGGAGAGQGREALSDWNPELQHALHSRGSEPVQLQRLPSLQLQQLGVH